MNLFPLTFTLPCRRSWIPRMSREEIFLLLIITSTAETDPVVVICQSPAEAHSMFVAAKNRDETPVFEFLSQPCGPRKLARALSLCMKRQLNQQSGRPSPEEPTRWVEMPESSHLPLNLEVSDPPPERMKISKRPATDAVRSPEYRSPRSLSMRTAEKWVRRLSRDRHRLWRRARGIQSSPVHSSY